MKVELHLLQSFPPHNLNRDDSGAPKDAEFGGHRRARLSSQSLKRAIRTSEIFKQIVADPEREGIRTRRLVKCLREMLMEEHKMDEPTAQTLARAATEALLKKVGPDDVSNVLYYAARAELRDLARRLAESEEARKAASASAETPPEVPAEEGEPAKGRKKGKKAPGNALQKAVGPIVEQFVKVHKGKTMAADVALFGRMLAEEPSLKLDAACQVAHALSVDRVAPAFDYFTAVDDLKDPEEEDAGADMIGTVGFNAACFYRYAVVDVRQLEKNLNGDGQAARDAVRAFLTAAVVALPTGKQNSFAAQARPELVMAVVRRGGVPLSLVNAFAEPVRPKDHSVAYHATERLAAHWAAMEAMYDGLLPDAASPEVFVATPYQAALESKKAEERLAQHALAPRWVPTVQEVIAKTMAALDAPLSTGANGTGTGSSEAQA
jgi:CRISPR system Cascade subunit CasC